MDVAYNILIGYQGVAKPKTCAKLERRYFNSLGLKLRVDTDALAAHTFR